MRVLSLFSGIGMFEYAWRQLGWEILVAAESDEWCRRVYAKHNPETKIYHDVKEVNYERLKKDGFTEFDVICGGFPCQDLSISGKQAGINGERSGLWSEFARIIGDIADGQKRMPIVIVENVTALLTGDSGGWMRQVAGDISRILSDHGGGEIEGHIIPAGNSEGRLSAGAQHERKRVWIVADPGEPRPRNQNRKTGNKKGSAGEIRGKSIRQESREVGTVWPNPTGSKRGNDADTKPQQPYRGDNRAPVKQMGQSVDGPARRLLGPGIIKALNEKHDIQLKWADGTWENGVARLLVDEKSRTLRLKALGNGLVWPIPYAIGKAIMERK